LYDTPRSRIRHSLAFRWFL